LPTCQHCHRNWTWKQTVKKSFTLSNQMTCPFCGEKQYISSKTRKRSGLLSFIPPLTMLITLLFDTSIFLTISMLIGSGLALIGIYPFMIELSNKEEPLW
jgi:CXXC-20-CXXC protein